MSGALLSAICASVVAVVSTALVLHRDYEDGLLGRIGLSLIALASIARALQLFGSDFERPVSPIGVLLWAGLALFLTRHLYRFLRWQRSGEGDWRGTDRAATCGKQ